MKQISTAMFILLVIMISVVSMSFAAVSGTVTDTSGDPAEGAFVTFTDETDSERQFSSYTDASGLYELSITPTGVDEDAPVPFHLHQNYPNPFNPPTPIPFTLDTAGHVAITVYNVMGQTVRVLADSYYGNGQHALMWDGRDNEGKNVAAGLFIYRLVSDNHSEARKMLLIDGGAGGQVSGGHYTRLHDSAKQAAICRREGISANLYYRWSKDFLESGKKRLLGDTEREATSTEVTGLKQENDQLKQLVAELSLKNRVLKKSLHGME